MKYTEYYQHLVNEAFGDAERIKWKAQVPTLTDAVIDDYIEKFQDIRTAKYRAAQDDIHNFNIAKGNDRYDISKYKQWNDFETFVDYVSGQVDLEKNKGQKLKDVEINDYKPLVDEHGLKIYYADTPRACIAYKGDIPYSWCVSRSSNNFYYTYRYRSHQPSFYFVKDVEATQKELSVPFTGTFKNPWHFFVIQKTKSGTYIVTSANNDGDVEMSWDEILKIQPKLEGMEHYFKHVRLTRAEVLKYKQFKSIDDTEFAKLKYTDKSLYMDMFPGEITDNKFNLLPEELKNKYIGFGLGLSTEQYNNIKNNKNLVKRFLQIIERRIEYYFKEDRISKLKDGDFGVLFDTKKGQTLLDSYISKDKGGYKSVVEIILHRAQQLKKNTDDFILHILSLESNFTNNEIRALIRYAPHPNIIVKFIIENNKNNFDWINDATETTYSLLLNGSTNFNELLDTLLKVRNTQSQTNELSSKIFKEILNISKDWTTTINTFKQNNYSINLDERDADTIIYGCDEKTLYDDATALIAELKDKYSNYNVKHLLYYLIHKSGTDEQKQKLVELIISVKSKLDDGAFGQIMIFAPAKEKTLLLILSNKKFDGNITKELLFTVSRYGSFHLNKNTTYTIINLILKYGKSKLDNLQKINLLAAADDVEEILELMKKYYVSIPPLISNYIKFILQNSMHPMNFAQFLKENNISVKITSREMHSLIYFAYEPVGLINALQFLKIPIVLSDRSILQILRKHENVSVRKQLIAKFIEIYGKSRLSYLSKIFQHIVPTV